MKAWPLSLIGLLVTAFAVDAHFLWIIPDGSNKAKVIFSDNLEPDEPSLLEKVAHTELWLRNPAGKETKLAWKQGKDAFLVEVPGEGNRTIGGICNYGVLTRGEKPFLLHYYPKLIVGDALTPQPWAKLPLDITPRQTKEGLFFQVLFQGKPAAKAEVVILAPGADKGESLTTDDKGEVKAAKVLKGRYAVRARHLETKEGEHGGKRYGEIRHYATLVMDVAGPLSGDPKVQLLAEDAKATKADPEATRLLAEARAARAWWQNFPGFTADIEVNLDGKISRGKVTIDAGGKVQLEQLDKDAEAWAKRTLGSLAGHRIDNSADRNTPCAMADGEANHPLGRAITVLNDELHSSYRIKEKQIMVVNREMGGSRFTITMLENRTNTEGKFLPVSYVVHYWDAKSGELQRTESHFQSWTRVGGFDLPVVAKTITATKELSAKSLTLSNHKLLQAASK